MSTAAAMTSTSGARPKRERNRRLCRANQGDNIAPNIDLCRAILSSRRIGSNKLLRIKRHGHCCSVPVRNDEHRAAGGTHGPVERLLDCGLTLCVQRARGLPHTRTTIQTWLCE
jgi:hypothetical protein